jgi:hypothetical protein
MGLSKTSIKGKNPKGADCDGNLLALHHLTARIGRDSS